jgi:hypothetical protein
VLAIVAGSTQGCVALVAGYMVGEAVSNSSKRTACHANMKTTNDSRIAKGQEPFPDTCGQ